ncbi:MAG: hypothetical protein ACOCG5_07220 [Candidatus Alkaliphilus sp. MAG34]|nr:hypothetical protein [Clostridiales bacterium]
MHNIKTENEFSATNDRRSEFAYVTQTTINEGIILKYRSFAGQTNPARLRMTKMWGLHSNDIWKHQQKIYLPLRATEGRPYIEEISK